MANVFYYLLFLLGCFKLAEFTEPGCEIELQCAECVPEHPPLVSAPRARAGDELALSCGAGRFLAYPLRARLLARCEAGRYRVLHDHALRHLLDLGCQASIFEDVQHEVEYCKSPLQGRAYQMTEEEGQAPRHLATLCYDEDSGVAAWARATGGPALRLPPHSHAPAPLSLLGNFNHMFDATTRRAAELLYSDGLRTDRRLRELFKHDRVTFAGQALTAGRLLAASYFEDQSARVADFASNKVPAWRSVVEGNLEHLQRDVARLVRQARPHAALDVYAGTHGVMALRTGAGAAAAEVRLRGERFPVPRYVWTLVAERGGARALAVAVLNDPFVAVSEVRAAVFCESACGRAAWLHELRRARRYETPLYGLAFCCDVHEFARNVTEIPREILAAVPPGEAGMLTDLYS